MSYQIVAPRMYKGRIESLVGRITGFADMIQLTHLKLQQVMSRMVPDGIYLDADGLAEIDLGNGTNYNPQEALNMFFQTGSVIGRSYTQDGDQNAGKVPIQEITSGSGGQKMQALIANYNYYLQMIRDCTGLNELETKKIATDFFQRLGDIAESAGVIICLEPCPASYGGNFMKTSTETAKMITIIRHPAIKMQLDLGAISINNEDPFEILFKYAELIGHVHASEPNLVPLGDGTTNHNNFFNFVSCCDRNSRFNNYDFKFFYIFSNIFNHFINII